MLEFTEQDRVAVNRAAERISEQILEDSLARMEEAKAKYGLKDHLIAMAVANAYMRVAGAMTATAFDVDMADLGTRINQALKNAMRATIPPHKSNEG